MIGIYAIREIRTGRRYIGQSVRVRDRLGGHVRALRAGIHANPFLQAAFKKHGEAAFVFEPMLGCVRDQLAFYERILVCGLRTDSAAYGFNLQVPTETSFQHSEISKAAIGAASRRQIPYVRTPEIRAKIAAGLTGKVGPNKGRKFSPEHRARMAATKRAMWADPERRQVTVDSRSVRSEAERAKISSSLKVLWATPQYRSQMLSARQ